MAHVEKWLLSPNHHGNVSPSRWAYEAPKRFWLVGLLTSGVTEMRDMNAFVRTFDEENWDV
ncbi:Uncharacterised protein [Serratia grimesii]|nr:Uncharacterised protein [Serratia grimesii]SMZ56161.1 Uncharacterised protein [Serratia grimesii]